MLWKAIAPSYNLKLARCKPLPISRKQTGEIVTYTVTAQFDDDGGLVYASLPFDSLEEARESARALATSPQCWTRKRGLTP